MLIATGVLCQDLEQFEVFKRHVSFSEVMHDTGSPAGDMHGKINRQQTSFADYQSPSASDTADEVCPSCVECPLQRVPMTLCACL